MKEKIISVCEKIIELCFYTLLIAVTFSNALIEIASTLMIFTWIFKKLLEKDVGFLKPVPVKILVLFFAWTIISCFNTQYAHESFRGVLKVLEYSLLFTITATSFKNKNIKIRAIVSMAFISLLMFVDGICQYFTGIDFIRHRTLMPGEGLRRISASFVHPNDFGAYLLVISILFIGLFLFSNREAVKIKLSMLFLAVLSCLSLFLTKSRGAWLGFVASVFLISAARSKKLILLFCVLLILMFFLMPPNSRDRIAELTDFQSGTTWERLKLWQGTIDMIKKHPVLGFGINTYSKVFPEYKPKDYPDIRYAHNSYLQMASETGIIGALLFIVFLVCVFAVAIKKIKHMPYGIDKGLTAALTAGLIGFSLNCAVDTHLYSISLVVFFHIMLGFLYSLVNGECHGKGTG